MPITSTGFPANAVFRRESKLRFVAAFSPKSQYAILFRSIGDGEFAYLASEIETCTRRQRYFESFGYRWGGIHWLARQRSALPARGRSRRPRRPEFRHSQQSELARTGR